MAKRKKAGPSRRTAARGGAGVRPLDEIFATVEGQESGIRIPGPAKRELAEWLKRGKRSGTIRTARESATVAAALVAAGVSQAQAEGAERLTIRHVKTGWNALLSVCPGNTPPHRCFRRSVLDREAFVVREVPDIRVLRQDFLLEPGEE